MGRAFDVQNCAKMSAFETGALRHFVSIADRRLKSLWFKEVKAIYGLDAWREARQGVTRYQVTNIA